MKPILTLLLFSPLFSLGQYDLSGSYVSGDTLYTRSGINIVQGEKLTIGTGSLPDGYFRYVRICSYSLFRRSSDKSGIKQPNAFSPLYKGLRFKVIRIDRRGNKKQTFDFYPIISAGLVRYEIDIDNAIASGEIVVPDESKPRTAVFNSPTEN